MQYFLILNHLIKLIYASHVGVVVANSFRSENTDPVVPIILYTILGEFFADSMMVSRMKGAHKHYHVMVHPLNSTEWTITFIT